MRLSWQKQVQNAITDPKELAAELLLERNLNDDLLLSKKKLQYYSLKVPRSFVQRMEKGNINDPLLRQILPMALESAISSEYVCDPLSESKFSPIPGLIHKYSGRVLLLVTGDCAVNCRFCFRRFCRTAITDWQKIYDYIANDASIREIILSGGEPLLLENDELRKLLDNLARISHLKRVRIHTRLPILIPDRVDQGLVNVLQNSKLQPIIVLHTNHPNELNEDVVAKLRLLHKNGALILNQSVLLKGVNDSVVALVELNEKLCAARVLPYYLHLLDKVAGAEHFAVDIITAKAIYAGMRKKLPGYLLPKMVRDIVGKEAKTVVL